MYVTRSPQLGLLPLVVNATSAALGLKQLFGGKDINTRIASAATHRVPLDPNYDWMAYFNSNPDLQQEWKNLSQSERGQITLVGQFGNDPKEYAQYHWNTSGKNEGRTPPPLITAIAQPVQVAAPAIAAQPVSTTYVDPQTNIPLQALNPAVMTTQPNTTNPAQQIIYQPIPTTQNNSGLSDLKWPLLALAAVMVLKK